MLFSMPFCCWSLFVGLLIDSEAFQKLCATQLYLSKLLHVLHKLLFIALDSQIDKASFGQKNFAVHIPTGHLTPDFAKQSSEQFK